jgi:hypothetical protein
MTDFYSRLCDNPYNFSIPKCWFAAISLSQNPYSVITHTPRLIPNSMGYNRVDCITIMVHLTELRFLRATELLIILYLHLHLQRG